MKKRLCNEWLHAALIRALRTFFQTVVATIGTTAVALDQVDWVKAVSVGLVAAILSMCTSLAGLPEVDEE